MGFLQNDCTFFPFAFTLSNSSIDARKLPNNRRRKLTEKIPYEKNLCSYPATLIGRLGVDKEKELKTRLMFFDLMLLT